MDNSAPIPNIQDEADLQHSVLRAIAKGQDGLGSLQHAIAGELGTALQAAADLISSARGRLIVSGIGKSGHIGAKLAATFASTGTPAFFVHLAEASHGDLGMIGPDDVVMAISWSGETAEMTNLVAYSRRFRVPLIALTAAPRSSLAKNADVVLCLPEVDEACPHGLAPTTSTLMQLAFGDALAIALLEGRGFSASDFKTFHPGGRLGANLTAVRHIMHTGDNVPIAQFGTLMSDAIVLISEKGFGCLGIVDADGKLAGIITDGDLRRHLASDLLDRRVDEIMTPDPKTIEPDAIIGKALELLNSSSITTLMVVENERPVGILHMHDILRIGAA